METTIPENTVVTRYRVPYADTDRMGVVYYGNYLTLFERARNELMRAMGPSYAQMEKDGLMLPVVEAHVDYRRPAFYDDMLDVAAWLAGTGSARCKVACAVSRDGKLLASGWTVHACVDAASRRPARLPDWLRECATPLH